MNALIGLAILLVLVAALYAALELRYHRGRQRIEAQQRDRVVRVLPPIGSTRKLDILPLVDWYPARPTLRGEAGVSYLVRTDHATLLLDVGLNTHADDPSTLQHNMRELGVSLGDIDTIVISHKHLDHVGGLRWLRRDTFSPGNEQPDLGGKRLVVPVPMNYPGSQPQVAAAPTLLAPGVATTGTIASQLFIGPVDEQALAVNIEGKGIVLIVGCGHPTLPRLLARAKALFKEPIYGIVGGLHYPVPHGRMMQAGVDLQNLVVFGPAHVPGREQIQHDSDQLAAESPQWVSLSAHDSSDETIEQFRHTFGPRFHDLRVGEWQHIGEPRAARIDAPEQRAA